jgi:hypothetical protein
LESFSKEKLFSFMLQLEAFGLMAVQIIKAMGYTVIATVDPLANLRSLKDTGLIISRIITTSHGSKMFQILLMVVEWI